jgi:formate hydrogenlyase subunit 3/multisubunit Na+/H+ antiporter MnhD subunit
VSAPFLWIIIPIIVGVFSLLLVSEHATAVTGGVAALVLAVLALIIPIDEAMLIGPISLKLSASVSFLGRSLVLPSAAAPLLALVFGMCALWFFGAEAAGVAARLIPMGLIITGLLVASIAVQPFLFASLLIETAVLVAVPLLAEPGERPGPGVIRFLIYQTLGMPFILLAGWLLAGVEASPGDLSFTIQSTVILGLGFAFLLAIFPLYNWIPQLMEESSPYLTGFLIWLLPTIAIVFAMSFLDRYAWLRSSTQVTAGLRLAGVVMLVSGAWWAAFEQHFGRLMAYTAIAETGFLLLALGLATGASASLVFLFLIPRGLGMAIWALALSILRRSDRTLQLASMRGLAHGYPFASAAIVLAALSSAGFPLLAGFPARLALWQALSSESLTTAVWFLIGLLGLLVGAVRQLAVLVMQTEEGRWKLGEDLIQRGMLSIGVAGLFLLGILPQLVGFIVQRLPLMFQHLNR